MFGKNKYHMTKELATRIAKAMNHWNEYRDSSSEEIQIYQTTGYNVVTVSDVMNMQPIFKKDGHTVFATQYYDVTICVWVRGDGSLLCQILYW